MKKLVPLFRVTLLAALLLGLAFNAGLPGASARSACPTRHSRENTPLKNGAVMAGVMACSRSSQARKR